ncbi:general transcription factor II-I repeat domain-containing protein 2-like [Hyperolius riggenbachi]|uniref:general transcription factor II-I repeat domain-containing protein 2-like n=1 Tax=Hyperolius riggenbachi TaxID=752182 RepID=UPI0035A3195F
MSGSRKRKVDSECRVFNKEWTAKYFFVESRSMAVCLICQETVAVFKEYNLSHHYNTKHGNYASKQTSQQREAIALRLAAKLHAQQSIFHKQNAIQEAKSKEKFEKISLSCRTVTRRVELIEEDIATTLITKADSFDFYSIALDESTDIKDTAQLLIFIRGINNNFEIMEEFLAMELLKGTTRGEDLFDHVSAGLEKMRLPWSKLVNVTTDGSPNLTGKKFVLLKRIQDRVKEDDPDKDVIFLHCIIHQESLCKSVLQLNHVANTVVKIVNFIRAKGLQHRQFIKFLEDTDADHEDLLYHSRVRWLSLGKVFELVWEIRTEIGTFLESQGKSDAFPELSDKTWLSDFAYGVDIFSHMNDLNVKLQGKDQYVHDMHTNVTAFKSRFSLFSKQISKKNFAHFPTLATLKEDIQDVKKYSRSLDDLHGEFSCRFTDFAKI